MPLSRTARRPLVAGAVLLALLGGVAPSAGAQPQTAFQHAVEMATAAMRNDSAAVARTLAAGVRADTPRDGNLTALMSAASWGRVGIARLLLARGADPLLENDRGETARDLATRAGHLDVARLLEAAERGQPLPEIRVPRNGRSNFEMAVELKSAAGLLGDLAQVRRLLDEGADPGFPTGDGSTALASAAYWGRLDVVRELLARGADPRHADAEGRTALDRARSQSHVDVVQELQRATGVAVDQPRRRQPPPAAAPATPAAATPAPATPAVATPPVPVRAGANTQLPPEEFAPTGVAPRGGVWEARVSNAAGLVRFTVAPDGRAITAIEFEGDIRCSDAGVGMGRSYGRTQRADYVTRGAQLVVDRGAVNGTYHDEKAGVHWAFQAHFVGPTSARGKLRIGAHANTCDTWGLQWTATRVR
ncbi:ankyrin repeat domain-containing protein [Roseisolibacter sp. H3M3-2]|uniref:ankyrin repeat domain-containing protein n=1 Tax=Roseisolibacter sp. H3M3-2 TaxID=3031323 RepID=UPI0023DA008D|nr:ankyrin repeat domain-containing protein [Roseisolibacter sp. H3M3-2]MDF1504895.1 ankyrin repeat domain-containing protein [Roseisolibacter sp. H3M3-2]